MSQTKIRIVVGAAVAVIVLLAVGQRACDRAGYWPHSEETRVYTGAAAWPADEERKCSALPREDGTIFFLGCVEGAENFDDARPVKVTFWGRTHRPDRFQALHSEAMEGWRWRCKKSGESVTCYAVN